MIHPQGAGLSSEEFTGLVVVGGTALVVEVEVGAEVDGAGLVVVASVLVGVGAALVVVLGGRVVVVLGGWLVVLVDGSLVVVVEGSAMAEEDSEVPLLVVVVLTEDSVVELAIGRDTPDPPDPQAAMARAAVPTSPVIVTARSSLGLGGMQSRSAYAVRKPGGACHLIRST